MMKKILYSAWAKLVAILLCATTSVCAIGLLFLVMELGKNGYYQLGEDGLKKSFYGAVAENYSAELLYNALMAEGSDKTHYDVVVATGGRRGFESSIRLESFPEESFSLFSDSERFSYGVVAANDDLSNIDLKNAKNWVYKSPGFDGDYDGYFEGQEEGTYAFDTTDLMRDIVSGSTHFETPEVISAESYRKFVDGVVAKSEYFCKDSAGTYYLYHGKDESDDAIGIDGKTWLIEIPEDMHVLLWCDYIDRSVTDEGTLYDYIYFRSTDGDYSWELWDDEKDSDILFNKLKSYEEENGEILVTANDDQVFDLFNDYKRDNRSLSYYVLYHINDPEAVDEINPVPESYGEYIDAGFAEADGIFEWLVFLFNSAGVLYPVMMIIAIGLFVWLCISCGRRADGSTGVLRRIDRLPLELYALGVFFMLGMVIAFVADATDTVLAVYPFGMVCRTYAAMAVGCAFIGISFILSIIARCKSRHFWGTTLIGTIGKKCIGFLTKPFKAAGERLSLNVTLSLIMGGYVLLQLILVLLAYSWNEPGLSVVMLIIFGVVACYGLLHLTGKLTKVSDAALERAMRSERMKTELITNVSHDIKTPLTSIINYVDLLQKEPIENEKAKEYMEVLNRQSARLKKLIDDLIEASKAQSGNLEVHLEKCDVGVLLTQVTGEYTERLSEAGIELLTESPEAPVSVMADGRYLFRVYDNLINNMYKYALSGTRAYIDIIKTGGRVQISFKNISKNRLNISADELMERFVRGDNSRSLEGNGLGLSIAKSLTELMDGSFELMIDGDLFKVTLDFPYVV